MGCTAEEIAEKRRLAMEKLKKTTAAFEATRTPNPTTNSTTNPTSNKKTITSPGTDTKPTSIFYGNGKNEKAETLNQYEIKMKHQTNHSSSNRILSQPYPKRDGTVTKNVQFTHATNNNSNSAQKFNSMFKKVINCTCSMISSTRFQVKESGYSARLIDIYKSIPTRAFSKLAMNNSQLSFFVSVNLPLCALNSCFDVWIILQIMIRKFGHSI